MSFDAKLGTAVVEVRAPLRLLKNDLAKTERSVAQSMQKISKGLTKAGKAMSLGITLPFIALGASTIKAASNVEELRNKFDVVFGEMSDSVREWAAVQSKAMKRSRFDFMEYLATLQDTFVPMGFARDQAAELSKSLTQLTVDVASFQEKQEPDVLRDFQSALVGNHETVRKYGVVITQATLDAELLANGISGGAKSATEMQKALARYNIILRNTTDSHGDAERSGGSFANSTKELKAAVKDLQVAFGQELLPAATGLVQGLTGLISKLNEMDPGTRKAVIGATAMAAAMGPLLIVLGKMAAGVAVLTRSWKKFRVPLLAVSTLLTGPVGLAIRATVAAVAAAGIAWAKWSDEIKAILRGIANAIKRYFEIMYGEEIVGQVGRWLDSIKGLWQDFFGWLEPKLKRIGLLSDDVMPPDTETKPETEGGAAGTATTGYTPFEIAPDPEAAAKAAAEQLKEEKEFLAERREAWLQATGEEIKLIEMRRDADIAALDEMKLSREGYAEAQKLIEKTADEEIKQIRDARLEAENDFLQSTHEAWLSATDQNIKLIESRRDAAIGALADMELSEEAAADARAMIWKTAAEEIKEIEKEKNDEITKGLKKLQEEMRDTFEGALTSFIQDLQKGEFSFRKFADTILSEIQRIAAQQLSKQITDAIFGASKTTTATAGGGVGGGGGGWGGAVGGVLSILSSLFSRQLGGPVMPGNLYTVGESGVELFSPRQAGTVIPHSEIGEAMTQRTVNVNMSIYTPDVDSFRRSQAQIANQTAIGVRQAQWRFS